jgi:hypothetical protein
MSTNNTSILNGRILRMSLFAVVAVILLAGAAYLWGARLYADVPQSSAPAPSYKGARVYADVPHFSASALSYNHLAGVSAVRALDATSASQPMENARPVLASSYQSLNGIAAVRAADDSIIVRSLSGVAAVRAFDAYSVGQ